MEVYKFTKTDSPQPNKTKEDILKAYSIWSGAFGLTNLLDTGIYKEAWYNFDLREDLKKYLTKDKNWQIKEYYAPSIALLRANIIHWNTLEITEINYENN